MSTRNDAFADAVPVIIFADGGTFTGPAQLHTGNTTETGEPQPASFPANRSAWWTYTPTSSGNAQIDTQLTTGGVDTEIAIYTGTAVNALTKIASNSDSGGSGTSLISSVALTGGVTYRIQVALWASTNDTAGNVQLRVIGPAAALDPADYFHSEPPGTLPRDWSTDQADPYRAPPWAPDEHPLTPGWREWAPITTDQMAAYRTQILAGASASPRRIVSKLANAWTVTWAASTSVAIGTVVRPTTGNGLLYVAVDGGTTAGTEPTWPSQFQSGGYVIDGGVTWVSAGRGAMCTSESIAAASDSWVYLFDAWPSRTEWTAQTLANFAAQLAADGTAFRCRLIAV